MANLKADAVAVVVASRHAANGVAVAVLQENAAAVVAVEVFVVLPIAVERNVLDEHVGRPLAGQQRKQRRAGRLARQPQVFS